MVDNLHIDLVRSGGFAGLSMKASVDTQQLPPETASAVHAALDGVDLSSVPATPRPAGAADRYQYDLTVTGPSQQHSVTFHEPGVPPDLQRLVDVLMPLASPGR